VNDDVQRMRRALIPIFAAGFIISVVGGIAGSPQLKLLGCLIETFAFFEQAAVAYGLRNGDA
jgi:hypothetical protein